VSGSFHNSGSVVADTDNKLVILRFLWAFGLSSADSRWNGPCTMRGEVGMEKTTVTRVEIIIWG